MEVLISEVRKRNVLWNKRNPHHKDRLYVDREWRSVAERTGFSREEARKKWRNLRDQFLKECRKLLKVKSEDSQDFAANYSGKWQYFTDLLFLKDSVLPRSTKGNVSFIEASTDTNSSNIVTEDNGDEYLEGDAITEINLKNDILQVDLEDMQTLSSKTTSNRPKRRPCVNYAEDGTEERLLDIENKKIALLAASEDENSLFLRSLLPYFQRMDPLQQLRVRTRFHEILLEELSQTQTSGRRVSTASYSMSPSSASPTVQTCYSNVTTSLSHIDSNFNSSSYITGK